MRRECPATVGSRRHAVRHVQPQIQESLWYARGRMAQHQAQTLCADGNENHLLLITMLSYQNVL